MVLLAEHLQQRQARDTKTSKIQMSSLSVSLMLKLVTAKLTMLPKQRCITPPSPVYTDDGEKYGHGSTSSSKREIILTFYLKAQSKHT